MNPQKSLSQDIWDGNYGGFGQDGVLARARRVYDAIPFKPLNAEGVGISAYASALYSVANGCFARGVRYYPLGLVAFARLYRLLVRELPLYFEVFGSSHMFRGKWTADQCETVAAILIKLSRIRILPVERTRDFRTRAGALVERGLALAEENKETSAHTRAFLYVHKGMLLFRQEAVLLDSTPNHPALWSVKALGDLGVECLQIAAKFAPAADDPNQRSRIYRGIAEAYSAYRKYRDPALEKAKQFMDKADAVPGISRSVAEKNAAARKRMGL